MTLSELKNLIDELYNKGGAEFIDYNVGVYLNPEGPALPSTIDIKVTRQEIIISDEE